MKRILSLFLVLALVVSTLPALAAISAGTRTILLTVAVSALAALLFPVKEAAENG